MFGVLYIESCINPQVTLQVLGCHQGRQLLSGLPE